MKPLRIAVAGIGAIGGWAAARFARAGHTVSALARGATLDALRTRGLLLTEAGQTETFRLAVASDDAQALGRQDLVVVAVKAHALAGVAPGIAALAGADTAIVPLLNGVPWWFFADNETFRDAPLEAVDPGGTIARAIPAANVVGGVVHASCSARAPADIVHGNGNRIILGEICGGRSARVGQVASVFERAGFEVPVSDRIQRDVWYKLWGNMTMNPISAITGATCEGILDDALVEAFVLRVMAEAKEVGARIGCPIAESGRDRIAVTRKLGAIKTSMLQDTEAGRAIELGALLEAPREIAARVGVPAPAMDSLLGLVRLFARSKGLLPA